MMPLRPIETSLLLGTWQVVATTLPFWRQRRDPRITYTLLPDGRWRDLVTFRTASGVPKQVLGVDVEKTPGTFMWRGSGWLAWCTSRWCFVDAEADWALTWFSAATLGVTPTGWDIYARDPDVEAGRILGWLQAVEGRAGHSLGSDWFVTTRGTRSDGGQALR